MVTQKTDETAMKPHLVAQNKTEISKSPNQPNLGYKTFEMPGDSNTGSYKSAFAQ